MHCLDIAFLDQVRTQVRRNMRSKINKTHCSSKQAMAVCLPDWLSQPSHPQGSWSSAKGGRGGWDVQPTIPYRTLSWCSTLKRHRTATPSRLHQACGSPKCYGFNKNSRNSPHVRPTIDEIKHLSWIQNLLESAQHFHTLQRKCESFELFLNDNKLTVKKTDIDSCQREATQLSP